MINYTVKDELLEVSLSMMTNLLEDLVNKTTAMLKDDEDEDPFYAKYPQVWINQANLFRKMSESIETMGLLSYFDLGSEWLEDVRLMMFAPEKFSTIKQIIDLDHSIINCIYNY